MTSNIARGIAVLDCLENNTLGFSNTNSLTKNQKLSLISTTSSSTRGSTSKIIVHTLDKVHSRSGAPGGGVMPPKNNF